MIELIDSNIYNVLLKMINPLNTHIMIGISFLGSAQVLITITILLILLLKNKRDSKYIAKNLIIIYFFNTFLKYIVKRPRPQSLALVIERGYSFPSAHSTISFAFYGFIIYLILKSNATKSKKIIYSIALSIIIFLIGISRIYLGVHYASDVIGGFIIGAIYLYLFIKFLYNNKNTRRK